MAKSKREQTMRDNADMDKRLKELGIEHPALLGETANNSDHRRQRDEYNRLLSGSSPESENAPEDQPNPSPPAPNVSPPPVSTDPPDDSTDPVKDESQDSLDDTEPWLPDEEPLIQIHQPPTASQPPEPAAPPGSPPDKLAPDIADIGQQMKSALQDAKDAITGSNQLVRDLQQQLVDIEAQDIELAMLRGKVREYDNAERTWTQEKQRQQEMQAALRKQLSVHQPIYDPEQLVCLNKKEHDLKFVERGKTVHRMWKWGCITSLAALLCTIIILIAVSFWSGSSTKTTEPPTSDLNLDFPVLKELR